MAGIMTGTVQVARTAGFVVTFAQRRGIGGRAG
jgi:hypothetical protein